MNIEFSQPIDIAQNVFLEHKGKWSLFASISVNQFNGTIHNNHFNGNQSYHNSLIVTIPYFQMSDNKFEQFNIGIKHSHEEVSYKMYSIFKSYLSLRFDEIL